MEWGVVLVLFGVFFALMLFSVPVSFSIGIATVATICLSKTFEQANFLVAQKMITGLDSFALLALPFFILAGNIMNRGGIAMRLINLAMVMVGRLPGALAHCNILANMLFGAVSGSAVASAAAVGSTMAPMQRKEGYDPGYSAAVNIASCPTGLLIPPSNTFIVYSLISGGTSVAALFLAGYLPGDSDGGRVDDCGRDYCEKTRLSGCATGGNECLFARSRSGHSAIIAGDRDYRRDY